MGQLKRRLTKMKLDTEYFVAVQMIVVIVTFCGGLSYCSFVLYHISSSRSQALNTSRASNTGRGSDVIVLIEAGGRGLHTDRVWQVCTVYS